MPVNSGRASAVLFDLAALGAGLLLPLAFAPFGWYPLAVVSPALLFLSWGGAGARRALLRGWLYGVGCFGFGIFWIHESFQYNQIGLWLALPLTALLTAGLALYPALLGLLVVRLPRGGVASRMLLVFPAGWVLIEWLRGWLFTGFGWLDLGYSQIDAPLGGLFPIGGVYAVSYAVALSAGALAWALHGLRRDRVVGLVAVALLWWGAAWLGARQWTEPAGAVLSVALVQGNVPQSRKWLPSMRAVTLKRYRDLSDRASGAALTVWPETALPGFKRQFNAYLADLGRRVRQRGGDLLLGLLTRRVGDGRPLNSVLLVGRDRGLYHKRHLVPFGEYLPLASLLGPIVRVLGIPVADLSPGPDRQRLLEVGGWPIGVSVCYEIAFGEEIRATLPAAAMLVTVSNDAWFGTSIGPYQHLQIARARARESGRWLLRATNTGLTAIVAPDGRIVARAPQFEAAVLSGSATPMRGATPYVLAGDWPVIVLALAMLLAGALMGRSAVRR